MPRATTAALIVPALLAMAGCAAGPGGQWAGADAEAAGFFAGLWHGALLLVTLVVSFFTDDVRVYEPHNVGLAYDIGFVLGVLAVWGNGIHIRFTRKKKCAPDADEIAKKMERKIRAKFSDLIDDDPEWADLGEKIERRVKDRLRQWLDEEKRDRD